MKEIIVLCRPAQEGTAKITKEFLRTQSNSITLCNKKRGKFKEKIVDTPEQVLYAMKVKEKRMLPMQEAARSRLKLWLKYNAKLQMGLLFPTSVAFHYNYYCYK